MPHKKGLVQGLVDGPEEQRLLVFRGHYKRMGQKLRIVVAQDYTPILESFARVQWMGLGAGALALLLVLLLQRLTVRRLAASAGGGAPADRPAAAGPA